METELKEYTVKELCEGFTYSKADGKGLYGLAGKLTIQLGCPVLCSSF